MGGDVGGCDEAARAAGGCQGGARCAARRGPRIYYEPMTWSRVRWWHGALVALLLLVLIGASLSWAIVRLYGPRFTRDRVEALLGEALGQPVRVGAVALRPWLLRLSLADVSTTADRSAPAPIGFRVRALDVILGIDSVWRRELVVSIALDDADVDAAVRPSGGGELHLFPLPESFAVGPLHLKIGAIRVTRTHVALRIADPALAIDVRGADVKARPHAGDLDVTLSAEWFAL